MRRRREINLPHRFFNIRVPTKFLQEGKSGLSRECCAAKGGGYVSDGVKFDACCPSSPTATPPSLESCTIFRCARRSQVTVYTNWQWQQIAFSCLLAIFIPRLLLVLVAGMAVRARRGRKRGGGNGAIYRAFQSSVSSRESSCPFFRHDENGVIYSVGYPNARRFHHGFFDRRF